MADVALPAMDVDAVYFAEALWSECVEVGGTVCIATGEIEHAVAWVADNIVGIGDEFCPDGVGLKGGDRCYGDGGADQEMVVSIKLVVDG